MKHSKTCELPGDVHDESPTSVEASAPSKTLVPSTASGFADGTIALSSTPPFVELLAQSNFSFLQGGSHPEEMVSQAKKQAYRGLAICDVNGLYGVVRGYQAAEKPSPFESEELSETDETGRSKKFFHYSFGSILTPYNSSPMCLYPMNKSGYSRLCHLITKAKRKSPKGEITLSLEDIRQAGEGQDLILAPLPPWSRDHLQLLKIAFEDRIYLPVHKDFTWESIRTYKQALQLERDLQLPLFATQRPLYHDPSRKPLHDVLTCILHKTTLAQAATKLTLNRERYLKHPSQIQALFHDRPDLVARTIEIARRLKFHLSELKYTYPRENLPPGKTATDHLRDLVEAGVQTRYGSRLERARTLPSGLEKKKEAAFFQKLRKQIEDELKLIAQLGYEDYFITLREICEFADSRDILYQGRGSAANSIVCFALKLTNVDPVEMGLMFGRFLSEERSEPPDIDIDFEHARREEILQHIYQKYGEQRAAMVCTVIRYRSRLAIREVGKVMGLSLTQVDALVKFMGREGLERLVDEQLRPLQPLIQEEGSPAETDAKSPDYGHRFDLKKIGLSPAQFQKLLHLSLAMHGFPRHLGIHTGGFVISHEPIVDIVPVESATKDNRFVIQWNKDDIEALKLMKIDILALGMLTAIKKCLNLLQSHRDTKWDMSQFPQDDSPTYDMICEADTIGVFQIESRAQMSLLPRLRPRNYYHLVIEVAIVRPGPIQGGMVHPFLRRKAGQEKVTYAHEKLKPILARTLGVPLFQEQVMQIAVAVAGFTPGEADGLRRVVSSAWKKKQVMEGLRLRVINGMLENNIPKEYAEQIYRTIEGFASYGFPESHAASFALLTYISCYLKKHHPDLFVCALLNSQPMGFYSPRQLIADAQRHGVKFQSLDVQRSEWDYQLDRARTTEPATFSTQPYDVRVGFRSVYGLKEDQIQNVLAERAANGEFRTLRDFIRRTKLPKSALIRLAAAGALQSLATSKTISGHNSSREMMWAIQGLCFDEKSLFFGAHAGLDEDRLEIESDMIPKENDWQFVHREYQTKGFSLDSHPLSVLRPHLQESSVRYVKAAELKSLKHRTKLRVAGLISLLQRPPTAKGMSFASVEDETGLMNIVIMPDVYAKCRLMILGVPLLEIDGWLECHQGVYNIRAEEIRPLLKKSPASLPARLTTGEVSYGKNV